MNVLEEEIAKAKATGRCMCCDAELKRTFTTSRGKVAYLHKRPVNCQTPECKAFFQALYYECVTRQKRKEKRDDARRVSEGSAANG